MLVGDAELAGEIGTLVGVVLGDGVVTDDGVHTTGGQVFEGQTDVVVFLDFGAHVGLAQHEHAGDADLAAHGQALEVGQAVDLLALGHDHGLHGAIVGDGEVEGLLALGSDGGGGSQDVVVTGGQTGEDAVPRHVAEGDLQIRAFGDLMDVVDGIAGGDLLVRQEFHGREGTVAGDHEGLGGHGSAHQDECAQGKSEFTEHNAASEKWEKRPGPDRASVPGPARIGSY